MVARAQRRQKGRADAAGEGGIHAGEIDGKDAGFLLARELLDGTVLPGVLEQVTFVFVPVFNVDGAERFGKNNRPNQRGPEEMGWRTTAQNLNLNRDYMKADAPEMRAMLALLRAWDPVLYMDLHVTDGAQFQHDVSVTGSRPRATLRTRCKRTWSPRVNKLGHHALDFYPSLNKDDDPSSGFSAGIAPPRFSTSYWALHGHIGMLVETHSWKDYATRVKTTHDVLVAALAEAAQHAREWTAPPDAERVVLAWTSTGETRPIDFLGYAYTRTPSPVSSTVTRSSTTRPSPRAWRVPYYGVLVPGVQVTLPRAAGSSRARSATSSPPSSPRTASSTAISRHAHARPLIALMTPSGAPRPSKGARRCRCTATGKESHTLTGGGIFVPVA